MNKLVVIHAINDRFIKIMTEMEAHKFLMSHETLYLCEISGSDWYLKSIYEE